MFVLNPAQRVIASIVGVILIVVAFWLALHFYGVHRYDEGVSATDAKWQAAAAKLHDDAALAGNAADAKAADRLKNYAANQQADQVAVNKAEAEGRSPLDALFGN